MGKILVVGSLEKQTLEYLNANAEVTVAPDNDPETIKALLRQGMEAIILRGYKITDDIMRAGTSLKVIARVAAGYNEINLKLAAEMGAYVCNSPGGNANATAEMTIALLFALTREIVPMHNDYVRGRFNTAGKTILDQKKEYGYMGHEVAGKNYGVLGYGRIGQLVVKKALGLGIHVLVYDPYLFGKVELPEGAEWVETLEELLPQCDFVSLHMPSMDSTRGLINKDTLALMKPTAFLVNEARGDIVVDEDIAWALNNDRLAGAALDCNEPEPLPFGHILRATKNVILTPHIGGYTEEAHVNLEMASAISAVQGVNGEVPQNCVNLKELGLAQ